MTELIRSLAVKPKQPVGSLVKPMQQSWASHAVLHWSTMSVLDPESSNKGEKPWLGVAHMELVLTPQSEPFLS